MLHKDHTLVTARMDTLGKIVKHVRLKFSFMTSNYVLASLPFDQSIYVLTEAPEAQWGRGAEGWRRVLVLIMTS